MTDVFLMGTSGNYNDPKRSLWREPIKEALSNLKVDCFDPVVEVWTEEYGKLEVEALLNAKILVMAITAETLGVASLAESGWAVLSGLLRKQSVGMYIDPQYKGEQTALTTMVVRIDALFNPSSESIDEASRRARKLVLSHANNITKQHSEVDLYVARDLEDLKNWTVSTAKRLNLGSKRK